MFQTLLSPLRSRFDFSPRSPTSNGNSPSSEQQGQTITSPRTPISATSSRFSLVSPRTAGSGATLSPGGLTPGGFGSFSSVLGGVAEQDVSPEDFARDVLIELMRNSVDDMKVRGAEGGESGIRGRIEILSEVLRIMQQDACTKAIFREMDGFLSLMSVLAALSVSINGPSPNETETTVPVSPVPALIEPASQLEEDRKECLRLTFMVLSDAMEDEEENEIYFRTKVTYASLKLALQSICSVNPPTLRLHILSLLLSLALADFSPPIMAFFTDLPQSSHGEDNAPFEEIDSHVKEVVESIAEPQTKKRKKTGTLKHAGAVRILWDLAEIADVQEDASSDIETRYALYKLLEALFTINHRNGGVLSSLGIVGGVFRRFEDVRKGLAAEVSSSATPSTMQSSIASLASITTGAIQNGDPSRGGREKEAEEDGWEKVEKRKELDGGRKRKEREKEKQALQKLLRRLLEMGSARTTEARALFQAAVPSSSEAPGTEEGEAVGQDPEEQRKQQTGKVKAQAQDQNREPPAPQQHRGEKLDPEILDVIRFGMKSRWVEHFSLEGPRAGLVLGDPELDPEGNGSGLKWKALPKDGFSFLMWFFPCTLPNAPYTLFSAISVTSSSPASHNGSGFFTLSPNFSQFPAPVPNVNRTVLRITLRPDGKISVFSNTASSSPNSHSGSVRSSLSPVASASRDQEAQEEEETVFSNIKLKKGRWTHFGLVWYQRKGSSRNPNLRLYIDGAFVEGINQTYPRVELNGSSSGVGVKYMIGDLGSSSSTLAGMTDTDGSQGKGDKEKEASMSWCLASAYFLGLPLADDLPRLIHHLGPRYTGSFQDLELVKFLTYEASTSLNMYLGSLSGHNSHLKRMSSIMHVQSQPAADAASGKGKNKNAQTSILKALRDGMPSMGLKDSSLIFIVAPDDFEWGADGAGGTEQASSQDDAHGTGGRRNNVSGLNLKGSAARSDPGVTLVGDVFVVKSESLDDALWKIGGAAVGLRLVQLASTQHELSRTLGILTDGLKNSWQNSEDMERLRGYEVLGGILRSKAHLVNLTAFETLFEFLGINFNSPEQSTVVNPLAYRALALDFSLWSHTRLEIQRAHLEQFSTLLELSRYRTFNWRQRLSKMGLVRKMLFALQADWYSHSQRGEQAGAGIGSVPPSAGAENFSMAEHLVEALGAVLKAPGGFEKEDVKALVAYLAANLHEKTAGELSPHSMISRFEFKSPPQEKAEQVLALLVRILSSQVHYTKFTTALPLTRILLLLLGEHPSPPVAVHILTLIAISIRVSSAFSRKFELVSGWNVLKTVLPGVWDPAVNRAAFDLLLGRVSLVPSTPGSAGIDGIMTSQATTPISAGRKEEREKAAKGSTTVSCTHILPTIISALRTGLIAVANNCLVSEDDPAAANLSWSTETTMEILIEELLTLHASSSTFRQIFESQQTTQLFIDTYKGMVTKLSGASHINGWNLGILEKLTHFGLALALDNTVGGSQKREILDKIESAEAILNPSAKGTLIDPGLVVDNRSVRQRIASARFSIQVGERTVIKTITRMSEWRKTVQASEKKRLRKTVLDMRENRRQVSRLTEWTNLLTSERGLWPRKTSVLWRLDETEGPHRIRKKLEPQNDSSPSSRVDALEEVTRGVNPPEADTSSVMQVEVPPWAESYEIASTEMEDRQQLAEDVVDDKLRRIRHELEPGDVIEAVATVARIDGVDSSPGLLILGRTHIYMLDGVVENEEGEVIDAHDAPKRLLFIPGSIVELNGPQKAQRWAHAQIASCSDKKFLFRDVALEVYFKDSRSLLIVFLDKKRRSDLEHRLSSIIGRPYSEIGLTPGPNPHIQRTPVFGRMGSRMLSGFRSDELSTATRKWQAREISNFAYLSILNQISGRTPSDATQYPVFPWVLSDYASQTLDLNNPASYRDLTKPMGALTPARRQAAEMRYSNLVSVGEEPFHYGTHFSSSMITLQGGDWDLPDRLFSDLPRAYESAAHDIRGDVRELIPEFFTCPEFLENSANHDFGVLQQTGEKIHDVKLPPWAREDPLLFISLNRKALESPVVSEHLPEWIDLIWGCKQRDPASLNVFHPLSYEGSIDLDAIKDDLEREATVGIIHNFGQTPRKLFNTPHPERYHHGLHSLPLGTLHGIEEDPHLLMQNSRCFKDLGPTTPVRELVPDIISEKITPCPEGILCLPQYPHEHVEWRSWSAELRVVVDQKVVQVVENAFCNCAAFADSTCLITGSSDYTVRLWKVSRGPHPHNAASGMRVTLSHIMRVHTDEVVTVAASRAWSLVVSGSKDGSAALWDLNRGVYVRSIWHGEGDESSAVNLVAVNESTGYIATCSRLKLCLHTVNGRPIATLDLTKTSSFSPLVPSITSMAFHEREYSHLGVLATGGPDGSITLRTWTADGTPEGEKAQWEFLTIRTMKVRMVGHNRPPAVMALKFLGESLYHGEETGKSYIWNLPDS